MQREGRTKQVWIAGPDNRIYLLTGLLVIFIDQLSKWLVYFFMQEGESVRILGDFFMLTFVYNPKGAFGLGSRAGSLYIFLSIVAILIIVYYFQRSHGVEKFLRFNLSLILGGAFGNILDRIFHGRVIDFVDVDFFNIHIHPFSLLGFRFGGYQIDRWPVFNFADCAVTVGTIGAIFYILFRRNNMENQINGQKPNDNDTIVKPTATHQ